MKKAASYLLSLVMMLGLLFVPTIQAQAANVSLGVSASTVNIGDTVTVTVSVPDGYTATVDLSFSSNVVSFVKASAEVGQNGSNVKINIGKLAPAGANSVSVTFKAHTSGTASFSASPASAVDNNTVEDVSLGGASTSITVANQTVDQPVTPPVDTPDPPVDNPPEEPKSADNSLSKLKLSSGTLSPGFKYNVTKYTATVGYDVTKIIVSAETSHEKAVIESVTGNGTVNLQVGENTIQIVVKAENGVKATYTVVVTRKVQETTTQPPGSESESDQPDTPDVPDTPDTPDEEPAFQWNGQKLQAAGEIPTELIPADFRETTTVVNSVEFPCMTFANANLKVLYLENEESTKGLFVYDEVQKTVYPFVKLVSENNYVIVLLPDEANVPTPENYKACTLSIEGKGVIHAYQFQQPVDETEETETTSWFTPEIFYAAEPVPTDFYLIYAMNKAGETGWYVYDSVEGTYQRYLTSLQTPSVDSEAEVDEDKDKEDTTDIAKLQNELEDAKKMQMIILGGAGFIIVVLIVIIVNLILRRRMEYDEIEDENYDSNAGEADEVHEAEMDEDVPDEVYESDTDEDTTKVVTAAEDEESDFCDITDEIMDDGEMEIEFYEMTEDAMEEADNDEVEVEFYEMTEDVMEETDDDEVEVEFYEMAEDVMEEADDDEVEVEFYEMIEDVTEETTEELTKKEDKEVEVEFYDMEDLLVQEAIAPAEASSKEKTKIPGKKAESSVQGKYTYSCDDDDDDLEFIEFD